MAIMSSNRINLTRGIKSGIDPAYLEASGDSVWKCPGGCVIDTSLGATRGFCQIGDTVKVCLHFAENTERGMREECSSYQSRKTNQSPCA